MNTHRMSASSLSCRLLPSLFLAAALSAPGATVLDADTLIGVNDLAYEHQDLVVSNAVLTVDGPHTFNSLRLTAGAVLTHTPTWDGPLWRLNHLTNELHQLSDTNPAWLVYGTILQDSITVTDTNGLVTYTNEVDYVITNLGSLFELRRTTNSFIPDGAFVFVSYDYQTVVDAGLDLTITTDFEVQPDASVNADQRGWTSESGRRGGSSGSPLSGGGGGHGGFGGLSSSGAAGGNTYGSTFNPLDLGGAGGEGYGGYGGTGGGGIQIHVGGNCVLDGTVTANGQNATNSRAGGGAGGSIWITAPTISGNGRVQADGGAGEPVHGGGGGGGRIALIATTNLFSGNISAVGGAGWQRGGAGTVLTQDDVAGPKLTIDNGGQSGAATLVNLSTSGTALVIQGRAHVVSASVAQQSMTNLMVRAGSTIATTATNLATLSWFVSGDAVIEAGATVQLGGRGYSPNLGPGTGFSSGTVGSGAGHGGYGGSGISGATVSPGGNTYDSISGPTMVGSGGRSIGIFPGGAGGGAVRLTVTGKLRLDGQIITDGTAASGNASGGASGGSVWLVLGDFAGSGLISADGGNGGLPYGGGGGGGRIAVIAAKSTFNGTLSAVGGIGAVSGGAGTIFTKLATSPYADLIVDNGGWTGTNTPSDLSLLQNLFISGGAICRPTVSSLTLGSVQVGTDSTWLLGSGSSGGNVTVASNLIVAAGGAISGDGLGFGGTQGSGSGSSSSLGSSGGGHGGYGGRGAGFTNTISSPGGNVYGSAANPTLPGSGGGSTQTTGIARNEGGGALRLTVSGTLVLEGRISVNGNSAFTNNSGGGSGGSLWLTLNRFAGSGQLAADGGNGHLPNGGGGGGGRIAVYWNSNSFTGTYSAKGGLGFVNGGAGTIYLKANNAPSPSLIVDNGGRRGTNTVLDISSLANLTLNSGASVTSSLSSLTIVSNLTIGPDATLGMGAVTLSIGGTAHIAAGGALRVDAASFSTAGSGQVHFQGSGGGGHGGYGGRGFGATGFGGNVYDSAASPSQAGSRGGAYNVSLGAAGGGALRLNVSGSMIVDGVLSANGAGAVTNSDGGGSGGSLWLTLNQLSGSGIISADGGRGHLPNGGGGGGGRIAIYYNTNAFTGVLSAKGGLGFGAGGAGTIYLRRNNSPAPTLIVDNGGTPGTNTPLNELSLQDLDVRSGATVTYSSFSLAVSNLHIAANATLRFSSLTLSIANSAIIEAGGSILASGGAGPGIGQTAPNGSGGGGHGGYGGRSSGNALGGNVYGSTGNPTQPGSLGGGSNQSGGSSGGTVRMTVSGPLVLNGSIAANGSSAMTNNGGGGSGGSILLSLNQFSGSGLISADGGSGHLPNGGGGGGGRIAVYWVTNAFTGSYSARGGGGFQAGGAGTIYLRSNNGQNQNPNLIVDNGGQRGTNTVTPDLATIADLTVRGGAVYQPAQHLSLTSLNIASNSTFLTSGFGYANIYLLNINGPAHVAAGGRIAADGMGYGSGSGTSGGAGATGLTGTGSGGGGHGGFGGSGYFTSRSSGMGGNAYDVLANPTQSGSGGGGNLSGGSGGGAIRITANGPFTLDGSISANGLHSVSNSGGGGAGGTVILNVTQLPLLGTGTITANGGNGHLPYGGGGGGGRIAVSYPYASSGPQRGPTNGFWGSYSAQGGNGFMKGGAGTIYIRTNYNNVAQVIVDNGGTRGTNTLVAGASSYDLTVMGGAVAVNLGFPRDVWVRSNAWLSAGQQFTSINIQRDAVFEAGGGIDLDGLAGNGPGSGSTFTTPKGGGGHGGYGGFQLGNSGNAYGSASAPTSGGSPGGNGSGSAGFGPYGGAGGGLAQLVVGRTLQLDGAISANGRDGEFNSGGGSGGGLRVQAVTFAGDGHITANGGHGNGTAGGGGGGRIAVHYATNLFTGSIAACGGNGGEAGGAGTIYLRDSVNLVSSLLLDNCGLAGASTPFASAIGLATNLMISGNATAEVQGVIPVFSNLVVNTGGIVTMRSSDTNLLLGLLGDLTIAQGGGIVVDGKGFAPTNGPGAGALLANQGAGGGYGGPGGASASGAAGGITYGSPTRPVDRGSGGGAGAGAPADGSAGGGAVRLAVAGTLALDGLISAGGAMGLQDDAGGGSGGSVWITAGKLTGQGTIAAAGGDGELYSGGGGGGGRIAIYSPMNTFTGQVSVAGGAGAAGGSTGSVFTSGSLGGLEIVSQSPAGVVSNLVGEILLGFSEPVNPLSVTPDDVRLHTPYGVLESSNLTLAVPAPGTLRLSFAAVNVPGDYRVEVGPELTDLWGTPMSQVYTGHYRVLLPTISGTVTDTNGQPVAGAALTPTDGLLPAVTDTNGNYSLALPAGWSGKVTPGWGEFTFVPGSRSYTNLSGDVINQNFQMVATLVTSLRVVTQGDDYMELIWEGFPEVPYQVYWSTNLSSGEWYPFAQPIIGSGKGPIEFHFSMPITGEPEKYFRLNAQN